MLRCSLHTEDINYPMAFCTIKLIEKELTIYWIVINSPLRYFILSKELLIHQSANLIFLSTEVMVSKRKIRPIAIQTTSPKIIEEGREHAKFIWSELANYEFTQLNNVKHKNFGQQHDTCTTPNKVNQLGNRTQVANPTKHDSSKVKHWIGRAIFCFWKNKNQ